MGKKQSLDEVGGLGGTTSGSEKTEEGSNELVDGPDSSSFSAFLYSLLSSSDAGGDNAKENNGGKKSLFSRSKQSLGRAILQAARIGGFRHHGRKDNNSEMNSDCLNGSVLNGVKMNHLATVKGKESESVSLVELSMLLSDAMRSTLYASLPALVHGRKWLLLYRFIPKLLIFYYDFDFTWRNGISLSTLYRRSMLWPGLSLLVPYNFP
ncbi:hypothetical protein Ahy_B09g098236 isoform D [Arachis hypogaea]|uniref:TLDc domain-containing protein n=1 Tax=Arachis hypogaea TaxID=3818 RepID=A0A444XQS2_ARAHY|nr:hypothetical protein Ahy_B09g098236 isoform D [Arachis hypogaea]